MESFGRRVKNDDYIEQADVLIDADSYEVYKSNVEGVSGFIDFKRTFDLMKRRDIKVAVIAPKKTDEIIDYNFELKE